MTRLYQLLLRLYPRHVRDEFGDEMLAVFAAAQHDGGGLWFLLRELSSVVRDAGQARPLPLGWISAAGGLAAALSIYWVVYAVFDHRIQRMYRSIQGASTQDDQLVVAIMALGALLLIVPTTVLACRETQRSVDRKRFRPAR